MKLTGEEGAWAKLGAEPNMAALGKRLGKDLKAVADEVRGWDDVAVRAYVTAGSATVKGGHVLSGGDVKVVRAVRPEVAGRFECIVDDSEGRPTSGKLLVALDAAQDDETRAMGAAREFANRVQKLRKKAGVKVRPPTAPAPSPPPPPPNPPLSLPRGG